MFWQKIQHHLSFFFLGTLVLAQGLIFVVSKANPPTKHDFKAVLVNPIAQSTHLIGDKISLQMQFDQAKINGRPVVYLVVASPEKNIRLNFDASQQADGIWQANNIWDTKDWPAGIYQISLVANIYDEQNNLQATKYSDINLIQLLDIDLAAKSAPAATSEQEVVISQVNEEQALSADTATSTTSSEATSTPSVATSTVAQVVEPERIISLVGVNLTVPANNSLNGNSQLALKLTTNFAADSFSLELINVDSTAISTGNVEINKTDGLTWNKTLNLNDTFLAGNYKLLVSATASQAGLVEDSFDLALVLPSVVKAEDIILTVTNPGNNLSGPVTIKASSNKNVNNLQFVFQDTLDKTEVLRVDGALQNSVSGGGQSYIYLLDTTQLPNGNYYLLAQSEVDSTTISSEAKLISTFNEQIATASSTAALATSTEALATSTEDMTVPSVSIDCIKSGITDAVLCARYQATLSGQIPEDCLAQNIFTAAACENYLRDNSLQLICQQNKLTDLKQCQDYLAEQYLSKVDCLSMDSEACRIILKEQYLYRLSAAQLRANKVAEVVKNKAGKTIQLAELAKELTVEDETVWQLPLLKLNTNVVLNRSNLQSILINADTLVVNNPAVLALDRDADLLVDDLEAYYGTDSAVPDSDGDGYLDGEEIKNGYNPAGEGKLIKERTPLDQVLLSQSALEQPYDDSMLVDPNWQLQQAANEGAGLSLSGQADPNTWINIYLYSSMPLVLSTKTDASGNWSYQFDQTLTEGLHKVYLASNDSSGKLLKQSAALSFAVTNISEEPVAVDNTNVAINQPAASKWWENLPFNIYYVLGGVCFLTFILGIILLLRRSRKIAANALVEETQATEEKTEV